MAGRGSIRFVPSAARQVLGRGVKQHAQSTLGITIPSVAKTTSYSFGKPLTAGFKMHGFAGCCCGYGEGLPGCRDRCKPKSRASRANRANGELVKLPSGRAAHRRSTEEPSPCGKPARDGTIRLQRWQVHTPMSALAMDEDALVIAQVAQNVRFDLVLVHLVVVPRAFAAGVTPRTFDDGSLAKEVGALHSVRLVRGAKNQPVAKIQSQDL